MMNSPVKQISESQRLASELHVEPEAKVMQSDLCRQACLEAIQRMWTRTPQPEGIEQFVIDRFNDLTQPSQRRQGLDQRTRLALMWGTVHLCTVSGVPIAT